LSQDLPSKWPASFALDFEFEEDFGARVVAISLLFTPAIETRCFSTILRSGGFLFGKRPMNASSESLLEGRL
jgi:hypothetical protein